MATEIQAVKVVTPEAAKAAFGRRFWDEVDHFVERVGEHILMNFYGGSLRVSAGVMGPHAAVRDEVAKRLRDAGWVVKYCDDSGGYEFIAK